MTDKEKIKEEIKEDCPELEEQHLKLCAKGINLGWLFDRIQNLAISKAMENCDSLWRKQFDVCVKANKDLAKAIFKKINEDVKYYKLMTKLDRDNLNVFLIRLEQSEKKWCER